jgi:signal transduction histidine kinase
MTSQKQLERLRDDFTAMMVHELRTPLTTISYGTDMLISDLPQLQPSEVNKNLETIKDTAAHMLSLVNQLLDVAKIESGKFEVFKKEENLTQLIGDEVAILKPIADQKQLQLIANLDPSISIVPFDRTRLRQALDNLIANAIKYTDRGHVEIQTKILDGQVMIAVTDSGDGIKPEDLPKLFSKFEQLGKGKTGEKMGTGLGLVVTKGIIEAHGGKIWATSPGVGKGSVFTFTLPRA